MAKFASGGTAFLALKNCCTEWMEQLETDDAASSHNSNDQGVKCMDSKHVFVVHSNECFLLKTWQTSSDAGVMPKVRIAERLRFDHAIELRWADPSIHRQKGSKQWLVVKGVACDCFCDCCQQKQSSSPLM